MQDYHAAEIKANLGIFAREAGAEPGQVMAFKVRQTLDPQGASSNRFFYSDDYDELATALKLPERRIGMYQGSGSRYLAVDAVIVEHETGPELIIFVSHIASAVDPFVTLVGAAGIILGMARWVRTKLETARKRPPPFPAYKDARYIRIERRRIRPDGTVDVVVLATNAVDGSFDVEAIKTQLIAGFRSD
ncbi:MAG: hypothetical protein ACREB7_12440 [Sphingopyxis sp.]|uniref:hypothetical protein n=1 Tax=Sphingopyxis sp. TaxID=1908224 RepID=UPI003D6D3F92